MVYGRLNDCNCSRCQPKPVNWNYVAALLGAFVFTFFAAWAAL